MNAERPVHLLLDLWAVRDPIHADHIRASLSGLPDLLDVKVFPEVGQAEVVLAAGTTVEANDVAEQVRRAGYGVRVARVPDSQEDPVYACYFHAAPDSSEARWVD